MNLLTLTSTNSRSGSTAASLVAPENSSTASCSKQWLSRPCRTIGWWADLATPNPNILGLTERSGYPLIRIVTSEAPWLLAGARASRARLTREESERRVSTGRHDIDRQSGCPDGVAASRRH